MFYISHFEITISHVDFVFVISHLFHMFVMSYFHFTAISHSCEICSSILEIFHVSHYKNECLDPTTT